MKYVKYLAYVDEAKNYGSAAELLADFGYPGDCPLSPDNLVRTFQIIFAVAHDDFAALTGSNRAAFARKFAIPSRSLQNWELGTREAPAYVLQMIGYILISELIDADASSKREVDSLF